MAGKYTMSPMRRVLGGAAFLVAIGLTIYFATTYTGVYRWLAELQLKYAGSYETQITFIVTLLILLAPFLVIAWILKKADRLAMGPATATAPASPATPPATASSTDLEVRRFLGRYGMTATFGCCGVIFFGM